MDKKDILRNVYEDFFGKDMKLEDEITDSEIFNVDNKKESLLSNIDISAIIKKVDELYLTEDSKTLLKKIIDYMNKYTKNEEKQFMPFNITVYGIDEKTLDNIICILNDAINVTSYLKTKEAQKFSFYNIEKAEQFEDIYNSKNNIVVIKDFKAFLSKEDTLKEKIIYTLSKKIDENEDKTITIFNAKNKEELEDIFVSSNKLKSEFSNFELTEIKPDVQDINQEILNKLEESIELNDKFKIKLLDYISATYPNYDMSYSEYIENLSQKILFNKEIPNYEKDKTMEEIFSELDELVGLAKVKKMLRELVDLVELKNKMKDDLKLKNINLHMCFLGNPGTGKTTVARIVAEILYNLKYIKQNKLIEVSSKDLVAEYVGQTAPKTMAVIEKAMGGVLFIDEAYSLASGKGQGNSYNEEAIATLIQAMENYRDNLVVIFAGYTREMQDFLDSNSGIVSRIGYTVEFEDYTSKELVQIFLNMMKKSGFVVSKDAIKKAEEIIEEARNTKNFGNARFARNLYEKTIVKHASNIKNINNKKILKTIKQEDISNEYVS